MKQNVKDTDGYLKDIGIFDEKLFAHFENIIKVDKHLTRQLVSFQANKNLSAYRWYKYKEAFSAALFQYLLFEFHIPKGILLDPFAGSGTTLFASSEIGYAAQGIELLPIGQQIIRNRINVTDLKQNDIKRIRFWKEKLPWKESKSVERINTLRITAGAYPDETEKSISQFLHAIKEEKENVREILFFALLSILESISYTRKDGQYLRWDYRSGRIRDKIKFDKGKIDTFEAAIISKLNDMINDINGKNIQLDLFADTKDKENITRGDIHFWF